MLRFIVILLVLLGHGEALAWTHGAGGIVSKSLVADFGATCNGDAVNTTATVSITSGTNTLTAGSALWSGGDVGKVIAVSGAGDQGPSSTVLYSKITVVSGGGTIATLRDNASHTLSASSQQIGWGTDDTPALQAFNDWVFSNSSINNNDKIQLVPPASPAKCQWLSVITSQFVGSAFNSFAIGVKNLQVVGNGATLTNTSNAQNIWPQFFLGAGGVFFDNLHDGRVNTVSAGSTSVTLTNSGTPCAPNCQSLFTVGNYALIAGVDQQGFGDPPNPFYYEYVLVTGISGATITFSAPLKNTYKSTWPLWNAGDGFHSDSGGPATLYALSPFWGASFEYDNLTIDQAAQTTSIGQNVTYSGVTFAGSVCIAPSQNQNMVLTNVNASGCSNGGNGIEADKIVDNLTITGGTYYQIFSQSASVNQMTMTNATVLHDLQGTPKKFVGNGLIVNGNLKVGTASYGRSDSFACTNCSIGTLQNGGVFTQNISTSFTMSGGLITANASNPQPWAIPGTNICWRSVRDCEQSFQVTDISQSGSNELVQTSYAGGYPTLPTNVNGLGAYVHPSPKFTCSGCTGDPVVVSLSNAPANAPLYSYQTYTYSGSVGTALQPAFEMWGNLTSLSMNVTNAYTGAGTLTFCLPQSGQVWPVIKSDGTEASLALCVNAKVAGNRVMTRSGVTCNGSAGTCDAGDTGWTVPDATTTWFSGPANAGSQYSANASASCPGAGCPSVTVTIQTDQGLVIP